MDRKFWYIFGAAVLFVLIFGRALAHLYTDWLWFGELGYTSVFKTVLFTRIQLGLIAGALFFVLVYSNLWLARRLAPPNTSRFYNNDIRLRIGNFAQRGINLIIFGLTLGVSILVGLEASTNWLGYQMFTNATNFGEVDPIFSRDIGFYVFQLGFLKYIYGWLLFTFLVTAIATAVVNYTDRAIEVFAGMPTFAPHVKAHLSLLFAGVLFVRAWGYRLDAYDLLYSPTGVVFGAGYTDIHARLIALKILTVVAVIAGILALVNIFRRGIVLPAAALGILVATSLLVGSIYPWFVQTYYVEPNEIARESGYIGHNIKATRAAFNLNKIEKRTFPSLDNLTAQDIENNRAVINSVRLWDYRPLDKTYSQLQELWQHYRISNIDIDRYIIDGELRQVTLAARELSLEGAPAGTGTWVNRHFQYTHGYGAVMSPVNRATAEGLPDFFIRGIPPISTVGIDIDVPQIYFGEMTTDYAIVRSMEQEFDYPAEGRPVYTTYEGEGGIAVGNYLRRLAFAWRFSDVNLVLTNPITEESRLMFRRHIRERAHTVFPFIIYDPDPYLVVSEGKLFWVQDAYTHSQRYPYSTPYRLAPTLSVNYMRNSIKIVTDAYNGNVDYYVADTEDPVLRTYQKIFPGVFKSMDEMPEGLLPHIRYPELLFRTQAEALLVYHMEEPQVFYTKAERWGIPEEIIGTSEQQSAMEPYYVVTKLPGEPKEEFILMLPFTPVNRNNMLAWLAAKCDPENYGHMILYEFPKDRLTYGPAQIETRIRQDDVIAPQLSLWDQRGARVNRGNLLVVPIEQSIMYVKPLYLESETSKIPELTRVIVAYKNRIVMERSLDAALAHFFGDEVVSPAETVQTAAPAAPGDDVADVDIVPSRVISPDVRRLIEQASAQYRRAQELQQQGDWAGYGEQLNRLEQTLKQLQDSAGGN